jgi:hypothetical protein
MLTSKESAKCICEFILNDNDNDNDNDKNKNNNKYYSPYRYLSWIDNLQKIYYLRPLQLVHECFVFMISRYYSSIKMTRSNSILDYKNRIQISFDKLSLYQQYKKYTQCLK